MDTKSKSTYITAGIFLVLVLLAIYFLFIFKKGPARIKPLESESFDVKPITDIDVSKRPYVTLTPTANGAEIIISVENMKEFERIEYELTYQADNPTAPGSKIERGAVGSDLNTQDAKYKKSVLLGTASRGVSSPDVGITEGKLTMHMYKGELEYLSESTWNLEQIGQKAATLKSVDGNFQIDIPGLGKNYWVILAETVGVPEASGNFDVKNANLPVYGVFSVAGEFTKAGQVQVKSTSNSGSSKLFALSHQDGTWEDLDAKYDSSAKTATASVSKFATFVLVSSK